jgi:hypothetical protein
MRFKMATKKPKGAASETREDLQKTLERIQEQERRIAALQIELDTVRERIKLMEADRPRTRLQTLASSFTSLLERMQAEGLKTAAGGIMGTLRSIDIDLKGFVEMAGEHPQVILPRPGETIDSNALSEVRLSFTTVPGNPPVSKERQ